MNFIFLLIFGFLLGSIPFGYLVAKIKGVNIKNFGSGATGATNISRAFGLKWAVVVAILDILKAGIPVYLALISPMPEWQISLICLAPVIGHIFTPWLKFKGGKGIACFVPSLIAFAGIWNFLILFIIWIILVKKVKLMAMVNLILMFLIPFFFWFYTNSITYFVLGILFFLIILWSHRENVYRLYNQKELKL